MKTCIFTFQSIHYVLKAEKLLLENNITPTIIPTPRDLSSNCGMSLRTIEKHKDEIMKILIKNNISTNYHLRD